MKHPAGVPPRFIRVGSTLRRRGPTVLSPPAHAPEAGSGSGPASPDCPKGPSCGSPRAPTVKEAAVRYDHRSGLEGESTVLPPIPRRHSH
ncbi:hypothetical protein NDU88_003053 [Pleurodeles waltl]|uniref:Uncharacterized protein n=1 Tax=Pleurodeles waltl TaxID=8319 RepID=A0AAV7W118_PLEWA|nr:hypothetical protein NDU88_003053 [Pleurodeles waltl]